MKKSEHHDIDRLFQIHFDRHEVAVTDRDALWRRIMPQPRRRVGVLFFFGLLVVVGSSFSLIFLMDEDAVESFSVQPSDDEARYEKLESIIDANQVQSSHLGGGGNIHQDVQEVSPVTSEEVSNEEVDKDNASILIITTGSSTPTTKVALSAKDGYASDQSSETKVLIKKDIELFAKASEEIINQVPIVITKTEVGQVPTAFLRPRLDNLNSISSSPLQALAIPEFSLQSPGIFKDKNPLNDCVVGGGGSFFVDIYTVLGAPLDKVSLNPGQADQIVLLDAWQERYNSLPSLSFGINIGYEFGSGLAIAGGAEYQRLESQYMTTQTITERVTVYDPEAFFFFDDQGQIVYVGDSVTAVSTFDRTSSVSNTTTMIHIPLEVSYPLLSKDNWNVRAIAGAAMNVSLQYRGRYVRPDLSVVEIDEANHSNYISTNIGLSIEGGLHLGHLIGDNWELYLSPRFRYNQQSFIRSTEVINQSRNFINLRSGLRYHF